MSRRAALLLLMAVGSAMPAFAQGPVPSAAPPADDGSEEGESHAAPSASAPTPMPVAAPWVGHQPVAEDHGMLLLPGGRFTMGSSLRGAPRSERARPMVIGPYWIDRTETTVADYQACVAAGACAAPQRSSAACTAGRGVPGLPISCVRWEDARAYCRFVRKRLPTEAEWEFAARGTRRVAYPWGGTGASCALAVTLLRDTSGHSCSPSGPAPVGAHPKGASAFGVLDLAGNVEEWVDDFWSESPPAEGRPASGASHVLRGGGWQTPPSRARTSSRSWGSSMEAGPNVGFRCARDP
jgi:formylglycine-generating enzyme required for sulfatase activity